MGGYRTLSKTQYYQEYYMKNKYRYRSYYQEQKQNKLNNILLFAPFGGQIEYYKKCYYDFLHNSK